ncbi:MAG: hypothetical protein R3D55_09540 [Chloroflexota bacterium]
MKFDWQAVVSLCLSRKWERPFLKTEQCRDDKPTKEILRPKQLLDANASYTEKILALLILVAVPLTITTGIISTIFLHKPLTYRVTNHLLPLIVQIIAWVLLKKKYPQTSANLVVWFTYHFDVQLAKRWWLALWGGDFAASFCGFGRCFARTALGNIANTIFNWLHWAVLSGFVGNGRKHARRLRQFSHRQHQFIIVYIVTLLSIDQLNIALNAARQNEQALKNSVEELHEPPSPKSWPKQPPRQNLNF